MYTYSYCNGNQCEYCDLSNTSISLPHQQVCYTFLKVMLSIRALQSRETLYYHEKVMNCSEVGIFIINITL